MYRIVREGIKKFSISGNILKVLAAIFMLIDHIGVILFPNVEILRIIGRLSFPIFAFMIAEGCHYTKNKARYFLTIFILGALCQIVYYLFDRQLEMSILITFSLSILIVYALQFMKESLFSNASGYVQKCFSVIIFVLTLGAVYCLNIFVSIDYGFWGCVSPLFASFLRSPSEKKLNFWKIVDKNIIHLFLFSICLVILSFSLGGIQFYSLISILLLALYSGKRGRIRIKYFFYIFYPLHLAVLQGIAYLI